MSVPKKFQRANCQLIDRVFLWLCLIIDSSDTLHHPDFTALCTLRGSSASLAALSIGEHQQTHQSKRLPRPLCHSVTTCLFSARVLLRSTSSCGKVLSDTKRWCASLLLVWLWELVREDIMEDLIQSNKRRLIVYFPKLLFYLASISLQAAMTVQECVHVHVCPCFEGDVLNQSARDVSYITFIAVLRP